jgi:2-methylisocitrate lyase-like PEP mutase family enzyme
LSPFTDPRLLLLPNAWDALSARLAQDSGAKAVGTTSAVLAWSRGYADGEQLPFDQLLREVRAIARVLRVPLTVDFERGYSTDPAIVAKHAVMLVEAGAAGINLEDQAADPRSLADKIRAVRSVVPREQLFINARTCVVLRGLTSEVSELVARARIYEEAGADGFFVPRLVKLETIEAVARGTALPLNVLLTPGLPSPPELERAGVRRLSMGPRVGEAAYSAAAQTIQEVLGGHGEPLRYPQLDALWSHRET